MLAISEQRNSYRKPMSSDRFRYKLLRGPWSSPGDYVRLLNSFGKSGWEVVHVQYDNGRPSEALLKMWVDEEETHEDVSDM